MNEHEITKLYRDAASEEPRASVDSAIIAAAHREAGAKPRRTHLRAWGISLATAAVLVLSATLVLLIQREERVVAREAEEPRSERDARLANKQSRDEERLAAGPSLSESAAVRGNADAMATAPEAKQETSDGTKETNSKNASAIPDEAKLREAPRAAPVAGREDEQSPAVWLARIERLRAEGKTEEVKKNLAEFRERYPQYALPAWAAEK